MIGPRIGPKVSDSLSCSQSAFFDLVVMPENKIIHKFYKLHGACLISTFPHLIKMLIK